MRELHPHEYASVSGNGLKQDLEKGWRKIKEGICELGNDIQDAWDKKVANAAMRGMDKLVEEKKEKEQKPEL